MKNTQGAIPRGVMREIEILDKASEHSWWKNKISFKQEMEKKDVDHWYGTGFGITHKNFGTGTEAVVSRIDISQDGKIILDTQTTELGNGSITSQALSFLILGRSASKVNSSVIDWSGYSLKKVMMLIQLHKNNKIKRFLIHVGLVMSYLIPLQVIPLTIFHMQLEKRVVLFLIMVFMPCITSLAERLYSQKNSYEFNAKMRIGQMGIY